METYRIFVVPMGNTKNTEELELQPRKDSVKKILRKKQGIIWIMKKLLRIKNHQVII